MSPAKLRQLRQRIHDAEDRSPAYAILLARRYLELDPEHVPIRVTLGRLLVELARYDEAEREHRLALRKCPDERRFLVLAEIGHLFAEQHRDAEAVKWYRLAIAANPVDAGARIYLGALLAKLGRFDEAEAAHRSAIDECYEGAIDEAWLNLGFVYRATSRFREAADAFREAIAIDPHYKDARRALRDVERCIKWEKKRKQT